MTPRFWLLVLTLIVARGAPAQELYVLDALGEPVLLDAASAPPTATVPVLFVHGHNASDSNDADFNFRKNWIDGLDALPSFAQALTAPINAGLDLEPYFIRFVDQSRSIVADAGDVRSAIDQIVARHVEGTRVVIIAYSKGALSSRLALKSLVEPVANMPPPQAGISPVSEFVAIAPPNHGVDIAGLFSDALSGDELNNGYSPTSATLGVCLPTGAAEARDFFERLNGHPMADSHADQMPLGSYPEEAPGSRPPGADPASGILYVTLYASGNRDFVGGDLPPGAAGNTVRDVPDCVLPTKQGRVLARNLAADAINLSLASIPGEDAATVHANTVHSGDVICRALHTAVHHAPPTAGECQTGPTVVPQIEPAQRVAVELVLDFSGSMAQPACADCAPKVQVLADAASLFIDLWQVVAAPGDRLGVTLVGSQARQMRCVHGQPCTTVGIGDAAQELSMDELQLPVRSSVMPIQNYIGTQTAAGNTAMGAGLANAIAKLARFDGMHRRAILLTDGMQNEPPLVVSEPSTCADGDCPLVIDVDPPLALDAALDIPVDTVGVGVGDAWLGLLSDISLATGGVSRATMSPDDDLAAFFTDNIVDTLQGFSPQRVARHRGTLTEAPVNHRFPVNANVGRVMLILRGEVTPSVLRGEEDLTAQGRMISRTGYQLWTLGLPPGPAASWNVSLEGKPGAAYDVSLLVDEPALEFRVSAGRRDYVVGESLELEATVTVDGVAIQTPVDVNVIVQRAGEAAANVLAEQNLFDPVAVKATSEFDNFSRLLQVTELRNRLVATGQSQPLTLDDGGRYTGQSAPLAIPGSRHLEFVVSGEHPRLGRFQRSRTLNVMVGIGQANAKISTLRAVSEPGRARWALFVTPRDAAGNHLGPGFAPRIRAHLDGASQGLAEDLGNGSYRMPLAAAATLDKPLRVSVSGHELFVGRLGDIAPPPKVVPREPWQYGIALALILLVLWWFRRVLRPNASRSGRRR